MAESRDKGGRRRLTIFFVTWQRKDMGSLAACTSTTTAMPLRARRPAIACKRGGAEASRRASMNVNNTHLKTSQQRKNLPLSSIIWRNKDMGSRAACTLTTKPISVRARRPNRTGNRLSGTTVSEQRDLLCVRIGCSIVCTNISLPATDRVWCE